MHVVLRHNFVSYLRCSGSTLCYYKATKIFKFLDCESRELQLLVCISLCFLNFCLEVAEINNASVVILCPKICTGLNVKLHLIASLHLPLKSAFKSLALLKAT